MYFTCLSPSRILAERMEAMQFLPPAFMLLILVSYQFPWGGRDKYSLYSTPLMGIFFFTLPPTSQTVTPFPHPIPTPSIWKSKMAAKGHDLWGEWMEITLVYSFQNIVLVLNLNLWHERQFRGTSCNGGQLGVRELTWNGWKPHRPVPCVGSLGAEGTKCFCPWMRCRAQHSLEHGEH